MPKKKSVSTYQRTMKGPNRRARFESKYTRFMLSEIILGLMEQEKVSVRVLAKKVGLSPAVIQDIRSGKRSNITIKNLLGITASLGATVNIEKDNRSYCLDCAEV